MVACCLLFLKVATSAEQALQMFSNARGVGKQGERGEERRRRGGEERRVRGANMCVCVCVCATQVVELT